MIGRAPGLAQQLDTGRLVDNGCLRRRQEDRQIDLAAAAMTIRPTAGLPVKKMWSKGSASNAVATSTPPSTTVTRSGAKHSATICAIRADVAGVSSDGFRIAEQPAASAETNGPSASWKGKFHGAMISAVPRACGTIRADDPSISSVGATRRGRIQRRR